MNRIIMLNNRSVIRKSIKNYFYSVLKISASALTAVCFISCAHKDVTGAQHAPPPQPSNNTIHIENDTPYFYINGILFHGWHRKEVSTCLPY